MCSCVAYVYGKCAVHGDGAGDVYGDGDADERQHHHHVPLVLGRAASPHRTPPHVEETDVLLFNIL